jgi:hypothetical protein
MIPMLIAHANNSLGHQRGHVGSRMAKEICNRMGCVGLLSYQHGFVMYKLG